jgi:septal ring factor EnvC (AmiA/AmiB activator)
MTELKEMTITEAATKAGEILDFMKPLQSAQEVLALAVTVERQTALSQANLERLQGQIKEQTARLEKVAGEFSHVTGELAAGRTELETMVIEKDRAQADRDKLLKEITLKRHELNDLGSRLDQARKTLL